jgi:ribosomal protein S18 acetylase RimI-like enzyme
MIFIHTSRDSEGALKIAEKLHGSYFDDKGIKDIKKEIKKEFYGAFNNDKMVGFITFKEVNIQVIELTWLAIDPDYQNKGIGTRLVTHSLQKLSRKYKACEVKTLSEDDPDEGYLKTRNFYKKLGFIPLQTIKPYPGWDKNMSCQIFVKFLSQ